MWYDKLFNVKYLPLFHHLKAIYQFPKHIIFLVKIVANASLTILNSTFMNSFTGPEGFLWQNYKTESTRS
jgi:hypothetical protein